MPSFRAPIGALLLTITIASCGGDADTASTTPATTPAATTAPTTPVTAIPSTVAPAATTADTTIADTVTPDTERSLVIQSGGLWLVDTATGERRPLPTTDGEQEGPDWSPDGSRIAFHTDFTTIWVADLDSGALTSVFECTAPCAVLQDPAWSPDGSEIAFMTAETDGTSTTRASIEAVDVDTGTQRSLYEDTSGTVWLFGPRWSPDGTEIVFDESTFASSSWDETVITDLRVGVVTIGEAAAPRYVAEWSGPLTGPGSPYPDWSPAGDLIVYSRGDNLYTVAPDGSATKQVTDFDAITEHAIQPTFSPLGDSIVFTYVAGAFDGTERAAAALINLDGSGFEVVADDATHPRLRPS